MVLRERLHLAVPESPVADPGVHEQNGRALAGRVVPDCRPVELRGRQFQSSADADDSRARRASVSSRAQAT